MTTQNEEIIADLIDNGWTFRYWAHPAICRWCHREILWHNVLVSPKGTLYHEGCAVQRYKEKAARG